MSDMMSNPMPNEGQFQKIIDIIESARERAYSKVNTLNWQRQRNKNEINQKVYDENHHLHRIRGFSGSITLYFEGKRQER